MASAVANSHYVCFNTRISSSTRDLAGGDEALRPPPPPEMKDLVDFEFRLDDPVAMLHADELFSEGKLVPLHLAAARPRIRLPEPAKSLAEISGSDPYAFSPRAPRCSIRWRDLLFLKKSPPKNPNPNPPNQFLHRNPRSTLTNSPLSFPLPRDSDSETISLSPSSSSSSSSSSSGTDHEDLPRLRLAPPRHDPPRILESPRMSSSGKVVFQGLGRSSSSPGSFYGGPRPRPRGMERSYSAHVRVDPVLNVPVCSLRGSARSGLPLGLGRFFPGSGYSRGSVSRTGSKGKTDNALSAPKD
ncbi:uncharacterized protein [Typha angustifolia]|uniref:uncharacterized protein n=1 Tax=Typha angustifolia TaxID=59011 RepID=UPI003C2AE8D0